MSTVFMKVELEPRVLNDTKVTSSGIITFELEDSDVEYHIGKAVYSIEKMGYPIDTHSVFLKVSEAYKALQLKKTYTKAVDIDGFGKVSFKN